MIGIFLSPFFGSFIKNSAYMIEVSTVANNKKSKLIDIRSKIL